MFLVELSTQPKTLMDAFFFARAKSVLFIRTNVVVIAVIRKSYHY